MGWRGRQARPPPLSPRRERGRGRVTERTLLRQGPRERLHRPGRRAGLPHRGLAPRRVAPEAGEGKGGWRRGGVRRPRRNRRLCAREKPGDAVQDQRQARGLRSRGEADGGVHRRAPAARRRRGRRRAHARSVAGVVCGRAVQDFCGDAHADQLLRRVLLDRALLPPGLRAALPARPGHVHLVPPQGDQGEGRRVRWRSVRGSRRGSLRALLLPRPQHHRHGGNLREGCDVGGEGG